MWWCVSRLTTGYLIFVNKHHETCITKERSMFYLGKVVDIPPAVPAGGAFDVKLDRSSSTLPPPPPRAKSFIMVMSNSGGMNEAPP